jgi:lipopolysaccharide biosynthesis glycosyltransferase
MARMSFLHVACAADEAYVPHCAAMLYSLFRHHPPGALRVHFLHGPGFPAAIVRQLSAWAAGQGADMRFHQIEDSEVSGLPDAGRISRVMWYRIFLPVCVPEADRILYLDCDTIVMDNPAPLFGSDMNGYLVAAVQNIFEKGMERRAHELGLDGAGQYFNSGVLMINLEGWRRERCTERILDFARQNASRLLWPDQDVLNTVLAGRWQALHPRWNCQNSFFYFPHARDVLGAGPLRMATRAPGILHFEGGELAKPWHYLCKNPYRVEYQRNLAHTPWPTQVLEGRTLVNRLLKPLPLTWLLPALRFVRRLQSALGSFKR